MTQEKKDLLLKDLCARLPYGAFVQFEVDGQKTIKPLNMDVLSSANIKCFKPYLRPMSSMTEEEIKEYTEIWANREPYMPGGTVDFFNAHHFDYCGLIPMGLALEAPEDMYHLN